MIVKVNENQSSILSYLYAHCSLLYIMYLLFIIVSLFNNSKFYRIDRSKYTEVLGSMSDEEMVDCMNVNEKSN